MNTTNLLAIVVRHGVVCPRPPGIDSVPLDSGKKELLFRDKLGHSAPVNSSPNGVSEERPDEPPKEARAEGSYAHGDEGVHGHELGDGIGHLRDRGDGNSGADKGSRGRYYGEDEGVDASLSAELEEGVPI